MKIIGLVAVMVGMIVLMVFGTSLISNVPEPAQNTTEHAIFTNFSSIVDISYTGMTGAVLILVVAIIVVAIGVMTGKKNI